MPAKAPEHRRDAALQAGLGIDDLGVGGAEVAVGREPERLADLRAGDVDHGRLDRPHRRRADAHVDDRRRAAPDDRRTRAWPAGG